MQSKISGKKFGLSDLLREMVEEADRRPSQPIQRRLRRGLIITITNREPMYHLVLKRKDSLPSYAEWEAVRKVWPWMTSATASEAGMKWSPCLQGWVGPRPMLLGEKHCLDARASKLGRELLTGLVKHEESRLKEVGYAPTVSGVKAAPKCPQHTRLQRGLHLEVVFDGEYRLRIWRDSGTPSDQEWVTVMQNWPWKVSVEPTASRMAVPPFLQGHIAPSPVQDKLL